MRAAALLLILAISATIPAGAQCVVTCVRPVTQPPCHHSPEKAQPTCDSSFVFGEKRAITVVEAPAASPAAGRRISGEPAPDCARLDLAAEPGAYPPGAIRHLVLRI
jgi:hypothetical protein